MKIGVLGTGMVGRALAGKLHEIGHDVLVGTRDPEALSARTESDSMGNPPFPLWHAEYQGVRTGTFSETAGHGEIVIERDIGLGHDRSVAGSR